MRAGRAFGQLLSKLGYLHYVTVECKMSPASSEFVNEGGTVRRSFTTLAALGLTVLLCMAAGAGARSHDASAQLSRASRPGPGHFLGLTFESRAGDLGGPVGADQLCRRAFAESHMCSYDEIGASAPELGQAIESDAWIDPPTSKFWASDLQTANGSCRDWHTGTVGLGTVIEQHGKLSLLPCSIPHRIACCAVAD